jgi:anti-anti-sigma factor
MGNNDLVRGFDDGDKDSGVALSLQPISSPGAIIIKAVGYIDTYNTTFFSKKVDKVIDNKIHNLVFDMGGVSYMSSTAIGSFTAFLKRVRILGGDIVLCNISPKVSEVFQLLGFASFFKIVNSKDEAIEVLSKSGTSSVFPYLFKCPICSKSLKAPKQGRFRCTACKTVLDVSQEARVSLG